MVEIIYKISDGSSYTDKLEAYRRELRYLQEKRDLLHRAVLKMKRGTLPSLTKNYLYAREKARAGRESIRKNLFPERRWLEKQAYFEALAKKFAALDELQTQIRVYKKLLAEYKEKRADCKTTFQLYKAVKEYREQKAALEVQEEGRSQ